MSAAAKAELQEALGGKAPLIAYDAVTNITFPDMASFKAFLVDPENLGKLREDSLNYAQPGQFQIGWGEEYVLVDDGKPVGEA
ncbi:hypothetical protein CALVIDRAFT_532341 [Calocera viscosa TUFC12733]|uniref:EthD domain-containing protein n=1 Tax=Calocera viscosa (strain TUFC12733) TaxID=1330018 RepID=A0A167S497_CALVF|nr:hypothetical protein CALVIDRAFT_532341 [Calocera viscosa TUFC12733]